MIEVTFPEGDDPETLVAARRAPDVSGDNMRRWWLEQHSALIKRVVRPPPVGYEQLHIDRDLS